MMARILSGLAVLAALTTLLFSLNGRKDDPREAARSTLTTHQSARAPQLENQRRSDQTTYPHAGSQDQQRLVERHLAGIQQGGAILERLLEQGVDLGQLALPTLEEDEARQRIAESLRLNSTERAEKRAARAGWAENGELLDAEWIRSQLQVDANPSESQLAELTAALLPLQFELEDAVDLYYDSLELAIDAEIKAGGFAAHPYAPPESAQESIQASRKRGGAFYAASTSISGSWVGSIRLFKDYYPDVVGQMATVRALRLARNEEAIKLIEKWDS